MSYKSRKQFFYGIIYLVIFGLIGAGIYFALTSKEATCFDGIQNQNEEGVDCGGSCNTCKTCYDSEQNCHSGSCEEGIDCGGVCTPCIVEEVGSSKIFGISR